ncbi:MAG: class I lanthipeptide [Cyclobacteriaceae bacterium]|nr:MAG: class I lanthipeptide [Cyclobacteriaceae bacterium]
MKKQRLKTKLSLNKETLGNLTKDQMRTVKGGETAECGQAPSLRADSQGWSCTCSWCACQ